MVKFENETCLNNQLKETNDKIEELSKVDVDDITNQLKELNKKYNYIYFNSYYDFSSIVGIGGK